MSPQQQQHQQNILNGPSSQKQAPSSINAVSHSSSDPSSESMSTLKTIAQEVVNRNNVNLVQTPPIMTQQQQQQQQNQFVMDTSIDPSSTANINSLISATSASSTAKTGTNEALIPPLLGVAPLGPSPLQKDHQQQVSISNLFILSN
jgi:CCR4-NOT transcription complex subunit 3